MKNCKCGKKPYKSIKYCENCFLRIFEKRMRKEMHNYIWFKKHEKVRLIDDKTCKTKIIEQLLIPILKEARIDVKIVKVKLKNARIILTDNLDDYNMAFLKAVMNNKKLEKDEYVRPLRQISDEEINTYSEIKDLKKLKRKKELIFDFMNAMDQRFPETKHAIINSIDLIKKSLD